jgi:hypothetical protein
VILDIAATRTTPASAAEKLAQEGVLVAPFGKTTLRAVTHLDADRQKIQMAIEVFRSVFSN